MIYLPRQWSTLHEVVHLVWVEQLSEGVDQLHALLASTLHIHQHQQRHHVVRDHLWLQQINTIHCYTRRIAPGADHARGRLHQGWITPGADHTRNRSHQGRITPGADHTRGGSQQALKIIKLFLELTRFKGDVTKT